MALDRVEIRCTDNEKKSWELAASKTPFRKVGTWLKWLANAAAETPLEMKLTIAGQSTVEAGSSPFGGLPAMPVASNPATGLPVLKRPNVEVDRDWDTGLPLVSLDGELIDPWEGEKTLFELRQAGHVSATISDIRAKLKGLN